ncbi:MAG TPA: mechanosensitive ion channel family protein [Thermoanaerobaculia bacterium]|jgi:small-conductance mechanosensitive channel|nr:mechanosensitive ion channel family protein [Thermoanaerobaculia bacterium]
MALLPPIAPIALVALIAFDMAAWERALSTPLLGNSAGDWLEALGIVALVLLTALLLKRVLGRRFARPPGAATAGSAAGAASAAQELAPELMRRTYWLLLLPPAVFLGILALAPSRHVYATLRTFAILAVLLQVALWATVGIEIWMGRVRRRRLEQDAASATLVGSFNFILRLVLWVFIVLLALDNLGVNVTALVAGLGVGGIAVALALQNILGDVLASLSIAADKPFVLGDTIQVDNFVGTVEDVGLKTTRLRSLSGEQLIFANSDLLKSRIRNLKRMTDRRVLLAFGIDYQTRADQVEKIPPLLRAIIEAQPGVRFDRAHLKGFGQGSLDLEAVYYLANPDYNLFMDTQEAILLALMRALEREGIRLAQPDRTLWIAAETEPPAPRSREGAAQPAAPAVRS